MKPSLASAQKSPVFFGGGRELIAVVGNLCVSPTKLKGHKG